MKGEESVDDVTEADRPGLLPCRREGMSEEVSSCETAIPVVTGRTRGLALCAAVMRSLRMGRPVIKREVRASGGCLGTERR